MRGKERVRVTLKHREPDRVPIWELGFHNAMARRILGRDVLLSTGGGKTMLAMLTASSQGRSARRDTISRIVDDTMTFYSHMGYDLVRVRPTDFATPFAFGSGNWPPNALLDVESEEFEPDKWRVSHPEGFWSIHYYDHESETLADADDPGQEKAEQARTRQEALNQGAGQLFSDIDRSVAEFEERYPEASRAMSSATQEAQAGKLNAKMKRSANALLYQRFARARRYQTDSANLLQKLSSDLQAAARHLPAVSREEIAEALSRIQEQARQAREAAREDPAASEQRLESIRERASRDIDSLAAAIRDPQLQRVGDELALPLGGSEAGDGSQRLLTLRQAAARVLERHLLAATVQRRLGLSRQTSTPPAKYRGLVEEYFKDLSRTE